MSNEHQVNGKQFSVAGKSYGKILNGILPSLSFYLVILQVQKLSVRAKNLTENLTLTAT